MKVKPTTSVFSVRTETDTLETFERILNENNANRNNTINEFLKGYIVEHSSKDRKTESISIFDNIEKLGFQKSFLDRIDGERIYEGQNLICKEEKHKNSPLRSDSEEEKEKEIQRIILTGVKYILKAYNVVLYTTFYFTENIFESGDKHIDIGNILFLYNTETDTFEDYSDYDLILP